MGSIPATLVLFNYSHVINRRKIYKKLPNHHINFYQKSYKRPPFLQTQPRINSPVPVWFRSVQGRVNRHILTLQLNSASSSRYGRQFKDTPLVKPVLVSPKRLSLFWNKYLPNVVSVTNPKGGKYSTRRLRLRPSSDMKLSLLLKPHSYRTLVKSNSTHLRFPPVQGLEKDQTTFKWVSNLKLNFGSGSSYDATALLERVTRSVLKGAQRFNDLTFVDYRRSPSNSSIGYLWILLQYTTSEAAFNFVKVFSSCFYKKNTFTWSNRLGSSLKPSVYFYQSQKLGTSKLGIPRLGQNFSSLKPSKAFLLASSPSRLIYNRYYNFIELSRADRIKGHTRPLYSYYFSTPFILKNHLISLRSTDWAAAFNKTIVNHRRSAANPGFLSFITNHTDDNLVESLFSQKVTSLPSRAPTLVSTSQPYTALEPSSHPLKNSLPSEAILGSSLNPQIVEYKPFFKFLFWGTYSHQLSCGRGNFVLNSFRLPSRFVSNHVLNSSINVFNRSNLVPVSNFSYVIRHKVIKMVVSSRYLPRTTPYFYHTLVSFIEFYTGKRVYLKLNPFIENTLSYVDIARCHLWHNRVMGFQKILGHRIFVHESLRIFHIALKFRDPTFLSNWIKAMLYRMSFWKYRVLLRYIKYVLQTLFFTYFAELDFKGVKLSIRGKISVAGNARTRTVSYAVGSTSHSQMNHRILSHFTTIHSFTGVMGFRLTFYY